MLGVLPSVEDMQRCIERKKVGRGGGISVTQSKTEVEEAGGVWNPATAATASVNGTLAAFNAAAASASAAANTAAKIAAETKARSPGSATAKAAEADLAAANAAAKNAAAAAANALSNATAAAEAAGASGARDDKGDADWDHPDTQVLSLREALSERDPLAYVLLRWLLSA